MFSDKASALQRLQKKIQYAELHLSRALDLSPQEYDDIVRLQDWLDSAYAEESDLIEQIEAEKKKLEDFFEEELEIEEKLIERLAYKMEKWKNAVVRVARDFSGRFVGERTIIAYYKPETWTTGNYQVARNALGHFVSWRKLSN